MRGNLGGGGGGGSSNSFNSFCIVGGVVILVIFFVSIISVIFSVQQTSSVANIQAKTGPHGPPGPQGETGDCNLTSFNGTFLAQILNIETLLYFNQNSSLISHPSNSIVVMNENDSTVLGSLTFSETDQCFTFQPGVCVNELGPTLGGSNPNIPKTFLFLDFLNQTINITDVFLDILASLNIKSSSIILNNQSFITIRELTPGDPSSTVLDIGGNWPVYFSSFLSLPLFIGGPNSYLSSNGSFLQNNLIIHTDSNMYIEVNQTLYYLDSLLDLTGTQITSNVSFMKYIILPNSTTGGITFGDNNNNQGRININSGCLTLDSETSCLLLKSSINQTTTIVSNLISLIGNVSFNSGSYITSVLNLIQGIQFPDAQTSIYKEPTTNCLTLKATQICMIANVSFNFSTPVTFTKPVEGSMILNGNFNVNGNLNINGSFNIQNLTVQNTLTSNIFYVNRTFVSSVTTYQSGSQQSFLSGSSIVMNSGSNLLITASSIVINSANSTAATCSLPYFSVESGCIPRCTNHSTCTDTYQALTVSNDLSVLGNIFTTSNLRPHPCCTGMGTTNFLYTSYSGTQGSLYNTSSTGDDDWKQLNLTFSSNNYPTLGNMLLYLPFFGGNNVTFNTTGQYSVDLSTQVDSSSSAKQIALALTCSTESDVSISPIFQGLNGVSINGKTIQRISTIWRRKFTSGDVCSFSILHSNGRLIVSVGRTSVLGIKLDNSIF
jgi:hypothetical protein